MALKYRLFISYFFFAIFILILAVYFHHTVKQNTYEPVTYFIVLFLLIVTVSILLASVFSKSIIVLSERLFLNNKKLEKEIKVRTDELEKSFHIIDKYVIRSSTDTQGIITDVSEAFCLISGYTKNELIGKPHSIVKHPNMMTIVYKEMWETISSGKSWSGIIQNRNKTGGSYWVRAFIEPEFDTNGNIQGYTAIRHNITNQILLQSQMQQNSAILNFANSAIGTMDFSGKFLTVNNVYTKLFGYTKEELIGKNCIDFTVDEEKEQVQEILSRAQREGIVSHEEKTCLDKFGNRVHIDISLNKLPGEKSFVVVVNSLEDKKKLEKINSSLAKQVDKEVQRNTVQLQAIQDEQLKHAKLSSIGLVAAGVIHEINTPLTYIKGNLEMFSVDIENLLEGKNKKDIQSDIEKIYSGVNRIENIVKSMREVSEVSSETKKAENIYATLITVLTIQQNNAKNISRIYINGDLFDPQTNKEKYSFYSKIQKQRLEQVWIVIINNALDELVKMEDYERRKLEITIEQENNSIIVKFQDNAGGINPKILPEIFEPLVSTKQSGGLGIGLNIAKKIVLDQGGDIAAYNSEDGAVFEVRLPLFKKEV